MTIITLSSSVCVFIQVAPGNMSRDTASKITFRLKIGEVLKKLHQVSHLLMWSTINLTYRNSFGEM